MKVITDEHIFDAPVQFLGGVRNSIGTLAPVSSPSISRSQVWKCSGSTITVTSLLGGLEGTTYRFLGDGTTTFQNGTYIVTNTGANKTLLANKVYRFTCINKVFYEDA